MEKSCQAGHTPTTVGERGDAAHLLHTINTICSSLFFVFSAVANEVDFETTLAWPTSFVTTAIPARCYGAARSRSQSAVLPAMSVKRKVTVPEGRSGMIRFHYVRPVVVRADCRMTDGQTTSEWLTISSSVSRRLTGTGSADPPLILRR